MPRFRFIWRAPAEPDVIAALDAQGVYVTTGGRRRSGTESFRHQLEIEADSLEEADRRLRLTIEEAGGLPSDLDEGRELP